jgi:hypothetical protein
VTFDPDAHAGNLIEVVTVKREAGDEVVIHAMAMRRRYQSLVSEPGDPDGSKKSKPYGCSKVLKDMARDAEAGLGDSKLRPAAGPGGRSSVSRPTLSVPGALGLTRIPA